MTTCIRASRSAPGSTGAVSGSRSPIVAIADGGINGLAALDDSAFDRMVADILMPNMRGFESIRVFHRRVPTVPLIAISGYAFFEEKWSQTGSHRPRSDGAPGNKHLCL